MSFFSKIWFPAALVSVVTLQMGLSHRDVEMNESIIPAAESPYCLADTVKYPKAGYKRFWSAEEKASVFAIADSLLGDAASGFGDEEAPVRFRPAALDSLIPPDSLLQLDSFRYYYYAALNDSLCHVWVRDSLINASDTLSWLKLDSLYAVDSTARAKAAYWDWYATLDRKERRKADFEREMPLKQARLDSIKEAKEERQAVKDSITENTPRILESFVFRDSLAYQRILKWTHERDFHNVTLIPEDTSYNYRFYDYPFLRKDVNATWLGVAGSPLQYYDFSLRKSREGVAFYDAIESWSYAPSDLPMYNTKTPYTELSYWGTLLAGDSKESDNLHLLTTQNITPELNVTLSFDRFGGEGILMNEATKNKTSVVSANYTGKKYLMHAGFINNSYSRTENGGVRDIGLIRDTTLEVREIAVNLSSASSKVKKSTVFLDQQYRIPFYFIEKWRHRKDTTDQVVLPADSGEPAEPVVVTGDEDEDIPPQEDDQAEEGEVPPADTLAFDDSQITTAFIGHSSEYSVYRRLYQDNLSSQNEKDFYDGIFNYHPSASYDSLRVMKLENKVFLRLQPWSAEAIVSKLDVGLGHKLMQYYSFDKTFTQTPSNHAWNATYLYAGVEGQFKRYFEWNARGKYVFLGDEINDFDLSGEARLNLYPFRRHRNSPLNVFARFNTSLDEPEYYLQHLYTNHYRWDNQFTKISTTTVEGGISVPLWQVGARVAYNLLAGNIWYGTDGFVNQNSDPMSVLSVSAYKNFSFGDLVHLDHRVLFQLSSRQDIVPLPLVAANVRYYIQFPVGPVKAMTMQIGANVWYNTAWYLPSWNPALGVFHNQEEVLYGNAPVADAFINMQWKRACIFVKMENANMGWPLETKDYFSADRYIRTTRAVKFGLYWPFYTQPGKDSHNHGSGPDSAGHESM